MVYGNDAGLIRSSRRRARLALSYAICVALALAGMEILSFLVIAVSSSYTGQEIRRTTEIFREQSEKIQALLSPEPKLLQLDPELGWRYRAGYRDSRNQISSQGARSAREYPPSPGPHVVRIAAFGNSFVYCNEVANEDAWPSLLEESVPGMEVLNYGVGGYGTDQAYLRYKSEGSALSPDVVVIGFAPVNLQRAVNVYRRFISNRELPLVKPRFILGSSGELVFRPNPASRPSDYAMYLGAPKLVLELGREDQWYNPWVYENPLYDYSATMRVFTAAWTGVNRRFLDPDRLLHGRMFNSSSKAFRIQMAIFERFNRAVFDNGAIPIVVILPDRDSLHAARRGAPRVFDSLVAQLRTKGITVVDPTDDLVSADPGFDVAGLFMPGGHYSPLGNRRIAGVLGRYLQQNIEPTVRASRLAQGAVAERATNNPCCPQGSR